MITYRFPQGSPAWHHIRCGIPTASAFDKLLTPKLKLADNATSRKYKHTLLAEWLFGRSMDEYVNQYMQRGSALEDEARCWYMRQTLCEVEQVGFALHDDGFCGCSPDGLVGDHGGLEVKCYEAVHHVANLLEPEDSHIPQIQGSLWLTGRKWWYRLYYNPHLPPVLVRVERDDEYIEVLSLAVMEFSRILRNDKQALLAMGCEPAREFAPEDYDPKTGELLQRLADNAEFDACVAAMREEQ